MHAFEESDIRDCDFSYKLYKPSYQDARSGACRHTRIVIQDLDVLSWGAYAFPRSQTILLSMEPVRAARKHAKYQRMCMCGRWAGQWRREVVLLVLLCIPAVTSWTGGHNFAGGLRRWPFPGQVSDGRDVSTGKGAGSALLKDASGSRASAAGIGLRASMETARLVGHGIFRHPFGSGEVAGWRGLRLGRLLLRKGGAGGCARGRAVPLGLSSLSSTVNDTVEGDDFDDQDEDQEDQMFLGLSEPSYEDTFFSEDSDRPAWNWDGDHIPTPRSRLLISGLDSWDTYDATIFDPMSNILAERADFTVPEWYDWNATTGDNYEGPEGQFFGPFKEIRAKLDYTYHVNYKESRQRLQDEIVNDWISKGKASENPWMIFTAGAMGSGKSHALRTMEEGGVPFLKDTVKVDPDKIKYQLPEMINYIARNPGPMPKGDAMVAGLATHNESGYLQELIVRELMERGKHLVVDGSLADSDWYIDYIQNIRARYPSYRIAIVHVRCNPVEVRRRVQVRCEQTGRCIAPQDVERSLRVTPFAVKRLSGLVDVLVEVENSVDTPFISSISLARHLVPGKDRGGPTVWSGMVRWISPKFWRRRTANARRQARSAIGAYNLHPHMRRYWLLDDTVEDELREGFQVMQSLLGDDEDEDGPVWTCRPEKSETGETPGVGGYV